MVIEREILKFSNACGKDILIYMEPSGEEIHLLSNDKAVIFEVAREDEALGIVEIVYHEDGISIFENRKFEIRIYVNGNLKYYTGPELLNFGR